MDIEEVQGLRDELLVKLRLRPQLFPQPRNSLNRGSSRTSNGEPIALGVAGGSKTGSYKMAVRIQGDLKSYEHLTGEIREACRGEVEIEEIGIAELRSLPNLQRTVRPLAIGSSISTPFGLTGTLGLFAKPFDSGDVCLLSCNHIISELNAASIGSLVLQPGTADGGKNGDHIGALSQLWPVLTTGEANLIDAAAATVDHKLFPLSNNVAGFGAIKTVGMVPSPRSKAMKLGRTTGLTHGFVRAHGIHNFRLSWKGEVAIFDSCIEIVGNRSRFSAPGDSGSIIFDQSGMAFGLLFSGASTFFRDITYANELTIVMNRLRLTL